MNPVDVEKGRKALGLFLGSMPRLGLLGGLARILCRQVNPLASEVRSLASEMAVDEGDLQLANMAYELEHAAWGGVQMGCTVACRWVDRRWEMHRILDWPLELTGLFMLRGQGQLTIPGYAGCLQGSNDKACVAMNYADPEGVSLRGTPISALLRQLLDSGADYKTIVITLLKSKPAAACYVTVCGMSEDECCALYLHTNGQHEMRKEKSILVQTNSWGTECPRQENARVQIRNEDLLGAGVLTACTVLYAVLCPGEKPQWV